MNISTVPGGFRVDETLRHYGVTVPTGFEFDGASVPWAVSWIIPRMSYEVAEAAAVHDYLYRNHSRSRFMADAIFRQILRDFDVPLWRRWLAWAGVRLFGGKPWKESK